MNVLSLCMIVKDEEHNLDKCLSSVAPYVDEIIVVDTGSTDKTKEIAAKYTDKVYDFEWINDFSAARNFSLSKASNDWVIVLDADEVVTEWDRVTTSGFINDNKNRRVFGMIRVESKIDKFGEQGTSHGSTIARVFNKKYSFYTGAIHEQVYVGGKAYAQMRQAIMKITVYHTGYTVAEAERKDKRTRNRSLLEKQLQEEPNNAYVKYQLAKEYFGINRNSEGIGLLKDALENSDTITKGYGADAVYCLGAAYHLEKRYAEGVQLKKYEACMGKNADFRFILGQMYFELGEYLEAALQFLHALQNKNADSKGVDSYLALEAMGMCYQNLDQYEDALVFYEKAYKDYDYLPAKTRYDNVRNYLETGEKR